MVFKPESGEVENSDCRKNGPHILIIPAADSDTMLVWNKTGKLDCQRTENHDQLSPG